MSQQQRTQWQTSLPGPFISANSTHELREGCHQVTTHRSSHPFDAFQLGLTARPVYVPHRLSKGTFMNRYFAAAGAVALLACTKAYGVDAAPAAAPAPAPSSTPEAGM